MMNHKNRILDSKNSGTHLAEHVVRNHRSNSIVGKLAVLASLTLMLIPGSALSASPVSQYREPVVPSLDTEACKYLTWCTRQILLNADQEQQEQKETYVPTSLSGKTGYILVTLRENGYHRGTGTAGPGPLVPMCEKATRLALDRVRSVIAGTQDQLGKLSIEIEVAGEDVPLPFGGDEFLSRDIKSIVEPGVHGVVMSYEGTVRRLCPSETIIYNKPVEESLNDIAELLCPHPEHLSFLYVGRFRSLHWAELKPGKGICILQRGMTPISQDDVTEVEIRNAVRRIGKYLVYRQQPSGLFASDFLPSDSKYAHDDNLVYQAGATWALSLWASRSGNPTARKAAQKAIQWFADRLTALPGVEGAGFIAGKPKKHKLGITALICLAMHDAPDAERWTKQREKLIQGILWLQQSEGRFLTAFPPSETLATQETYPGLALLALARSYEDEPSQPIMQAFDKALKFYSNYFDKNPDPGFVPRQIQAFSRMAVYSKRDDFSKYVFTMADALAAGQLSRSNWPWQDAWGAIVPEAPHTASVRTGLYIEALADARKLARVLKDAKRAEQYTSVISNATRFLLQLEFHPEETWYIPRKKEVIGGVRKKLWDNTIRLVNCEYSIMGLMEAQNLFKKTGEK